VYLFYALRLDGSYVSGCGLINMIEQRLSFSRSHTLRLRLSA
jgi:hypothetical protein